MVDLCCCGIHVHRGTLIIAVLTFVASIFSIAADLGKWARYENYHRGPSRHPLQSFHGLVYYNPVIDVLVSVALFICSALLIYANRTKRPQLYWPFISICYFELCFEVFRVAMFVVAVLAAVLGDEDDRLPRPMIPEDKELEVLSVLVLFGAVAIAFFCVILYFARVVRRGRDYLLATADQKIGGSAQSATYSIGGHTVHIKDGPFKENFTWAQAQP